MFARYYTLVMVVIISLFGVSSVYALDMINRNVQATSDARICSPSSTRGTANQGPAVTLFNLTALQQAYFAKVVPGADLSSSIMGEIQGALSRNNNDRVNAATGKCQNNANHGAWTAQELSRWSSFWGGASQAFQAVFPNVSLTASPISVNDAAKMQEYIRWACGLSLGTDGKLGIKTLNAVRICTPPCQGKCGRDLFQSLKDRLFYDKNGTKAIYKDTSFTADGNPATDMMYLDGDALTTVPEGLDAYLTVSEGKVTARDGSSEATMQTERGIGLVERAELCPLTPLQITTVNSLPLSDLPNRPIIELEGPSCFLASQTSSQGAALPVATIKSSVNAGLAQSNNTDITPAMIERLGGGRQGGLCANVSINSFIVQLDKEYTASLNTTACCRARVADLPSTQEAAFVQQANQGASQQTSQTISYAYCTSPLGTGGSEAQAAAECSLQGEAGSVITTNGACKCASNYKRVWTPDGEKCEKCDPVKCNCGVKLNTNMPFIGRCIVHGNTNNTGDPDFVGDGADANTTIVVNQLTAFPVLVSGLIKILMVLLGLFNFATLIVGGVQMTMPDSYDEGWGKVKGVGIALAVVGALAAVLYLINPNFFT